MAVANRRYDLAELGTCLLFLHTPVRHEIVIELAATHMLHDKEERVPGFNHFVQFDNVRMVKHWLTGKVTLMNGTGCNHAAMI